MQIHQHRHNISFVNLKVNYKQIFKVVQSETELVPSRLLYFESYVLYFLVTRLKIDENKSRYSPSNLPSN